MKRGGSLDNQMMYYTVVIIAVLNLFAYLSIGDWRSIGWFVVSGLCMYVLNPNRTVALVVAILGAALNRSVYVEGMTKKTKSIDKLTELKDIMNGANLEGLTQKAGKLMSQQKELFGMAKEMGPFMSQANEMMKNLPPGFLEKAMNNMGNKKDKKE
jgi:hypothetical protein